MLLDEYVGRLETQVSELTVIYQQQSFDDLFDYNKF